MSKIPNDIRLKLARENWGGVWELNKSMGALLVQIEAGEASESTKVNAPKPFLSQGNSSTPSTASSLVARVQNFQSVYCHGSHSSASCNKVRGVKEHFYTSGPLFCLSQAQPLG